MSSGATIQAKPKFLMTPAVSGFQMDGVELGPSEGLVLHYPAAEGSRHGTKLHWFTQAKLHAVGDSNGELYEVLQSHYIIHYRLKAQGTVEPLMIGG